MDILQKYVVKSDNIIPAWLNDELARGRAQLNFQDDKVVSITTHSVGGTHVANVGDVIIKTQSGLAAISREKAIQYKLIDEPKVKIVSEPKRRRK